MQGDAASWLKLGTQGERVARIRDLDGQCSARFQRRGEPGELARIEFVARIETLQRGFDLGASSARMD